MKKNKLKLLSLISALCMVLLVGCGSFDASGYVKAVLDNSYKGESANLISMSKGTEEDAAAIYEESIQNNLDAMISGYELDTELADAYRTFVIDFLGKANYEVGEAVKNDDGSYTVTVKAFPLTLALNDAMTQVQTDYIAKIQEDMANGAEQPTTEVMYAEIYRLALDCLTDSLAAAEYGEGVDVTVDVAIEDKVYAPDQSDLDNLTSTLFVLQ